MTFGEKILSLRKKNEWSQQELAEKIETADVRQYYSQITKETFESYQNSGLQFKEIAEEFHITTTALQQWRKDNGYPIYNKNNRK